MNLYIVRNTIPFPSSEYGDMFVVAAENTEQVKELIKDYHDEMSLEEYLEDIEEACENAILISTNSIFQDKIVDSFST